MAEKYYSISPYVYCANNPLKFIDPTGMAYWYTEDGIYVGTDGKDDNKVYVAERASGSKKFVYGKVRELGVGHDEFKKKAATVYGESSVGFGIESKEEMFAIASVHEKNDIAYGANSELAKSFSQTSLEEQTETMQIANAAVINAVSGGVDYSNGADQWDGAEQGMVSKANMDKASNGSFMYKMNTMGWNIQNDHYDSWGTAINNKFGKGSFTVPQVKSATANYKGMKNKGKTRLSSTAQYGLTIFWKTN